MATEISNLTLTWKRSDRGNSTGKSGLPSHYVSERRNEIGSGEYWMAREKCMEVAE